MIEKKIRHLETLRELRRILHRGVVLLIRMEAVPLLIEAERLMKQPVGALRVLLLELCIVRLITAAADLPTIAHLIEIAELLRLRGADIEEGHLVSIDHTGLAILDRNQVQAVTDKLHLTRLQQLPGDIIEQLDDFLVAIDIGLALVLAGLHVLRDETHHPDHPREVIDMLVCQEDLPHIHPVQSRILQLMHDLSAATGVHHKVLLRPLLLLIRQHIAGIVNLRHERIARTKHRDFHLHTLLIVGFSAYILQRFFA